VRLVALAAVVSVAGVVAAGSPAQTAKAGSIHTFRTPSGNIVCASWGYVISGRPSFGVECGIRSGLVGARPSTTCGPGDPSVSRVQLAARGRATRVLCAGDPGPFLYVAAPILRYGRTWHRAGISCASARTGLTCRNRTGHGFFLSRERWRLF
jgi:Family of unknown function (DUF6636)